MLMNNELNWTYLRDSDVIEFLENYAISGYECIYSNGWKLYDGRISDQHTELLATGECLKKLVFNAIHFPYRHQEWSRLCI